MAGEPGHPGALVHGRRVDEVRGDLHARHEIALVDDLAVEGGEHFERIDPVDPLELGDPDVEHARERSEQVHPALGRSADRQARPGDGRGQAERRIVLVELAGLRHQDA